MENKHDVQELVARHLKALYKEMDDTGACDECVMHLLAASAIGSIIKEYGAGMTLIKFIDSAITFALDCEANGTVEVVMRDEKKVH